MKLLVGFRHVRRHRLGHHHLHLFAAIPFQQYIEQVVLKIHVAGQHAVAVAKKERVIERKEYMLVLID